MTLTRTPDPTRSTEVTSVGFSLFSGGWQQKTSAVRDRKPRRAFIAGCCHM